MSLTRDQESTLNRRLTAWSAALADAIREHGADNSFGVMELAGEYPLTRKDGYAIAQNGRVPELQKWLHEKHGIDVELEYRRARFFTRPRGAAAPAANVMHPKARANIGAFVLSKLGLETLALHRPAPGEGPAVKALRALVVKLGLPENTAMRDSLRAEYEAGLAALMGPEYAAAKSTHVSKAWDHPDGSAHSITGPLGCFPCANLRREAKKPGLVAVHCEHDAEIPCASVGCPYGGPKCKACGGPCSSAEEVCEGCGR